MGMMINDPPIETGEQLRTILDRISLAQSTVDFQWAFRFRPVTLHFDGDPVHARTGWLVWAEFTRPDIRDGVVGVGRGRDEILWRGASESAAVKTCWMLFRQILEHEALEAFRYEGVQIFNPHNTVRELMLPAAARGRQEQLDTYAINGGR